MPTATGPTATTLKYSEIVDVNIAPQAVNFADSEDYGHRVLVEVTKDGLQGFLGWTRASGSDRPVGAALAGGEAAFKTALESALNTSYVDLDGVTGGLHFSSAVMTTAVGNDARLRDSTIGISANDLPMAFVLFKLYGASDATTFEVIYNLADAHGMLTSAAVADAIADSFLDTANNAEGGAVDQMFRDLLSADPARFFDASGNQVPGLFEVAVDADASGNWGLVLNDIIEVKLKLIFANEVTRRGVFGREHDITNEAGPEDEQVVIEPNDYFYVRLQMKVKA